MKEPPFLLGAIEGGGTKFLCAVGFPGHEFVDSTSVPTGEPGATLDACARFFQAACRRHGPIKALGVACFGPLQLRRDAPDHGRLLNTPKPGWSNVDLLTPLRAQLAVPVVLDTDVGAAAMAEWKLGAGGGLASMVYVTIGTGIGGAFVPEPRGARLMHPEMGHLLLPVDPREAGFAGTCPFHGHCAEGLASGPAIRARWGMDLQALADGHPGRDIIAGYLGQLMTSITLMLSPQCIVLGGGVMSDPSMLPRVRTHTHQYLHGYVPPLRELAGFEAYLRAPQLGSRSGLTGALLLAHAAAQGRTG